MNLGKKIFLSFSLLIFSSLVGGIFEEAVSQTPKTNKITVMMDWSIGGKYASYFVALDKGFYRDEGIDAEITRGYGGAPRP